MSKDGMVFGLEPGVLRVILTTGADFDQELEIQGGDWEEDEGLSIVLPGVTWDAELSGSSAVWHVDSEDADTIPNGSLAQLKYTKGDRKQIWEIGTVIRRC